MKVLFLAPFLGVLNVDLDGSKKKCSLGDLVGRRCHVQGMGWGLRS